MTTALYRRYRPDSFADVIGQEHVTEPLMTALQKNRVNHAYLFSGPRGCGKTTSARILARCLNCAQGPTSTPCGSCESCVELATGGSGSLDVIEIDAASHGGVDDARDLRERASFAPVRDRYKIFIIDEAHMVTSAGFNALLKIVEEPPEHIKFIFATTEPDKVIGTIRSRTHHYPFRLVPPEPLMAYLNVLCERERVAVAPGALSLVIRAGGGSVRDTLSVLDQLMAGAGQGGLDYELAVSLLGYTHASLLDDIVDALAATDAGTVFRAVDRVIQTGLDPRRFVEDLLERFRDLIIVQALPGNAQTVLRGMPEDQIARMETQATQLGRAELSRAADISNEALNEMTGATSPRLHLELLCARLLLPGAEQGERGLATRLERIERRLSYATDDMPPQGGRGVQGSAPRTGPKPTSEPSPAPAAQPASMPPTGERPESAPGAVMAPGPSGPGPAVGNRPADPWDNTPGIATADSTTAAPPAQAGASPAQSAAQGPSVRETPDAALGFPDGTASPDGTPQGGTPQGGTPQREKPQGRTPQGGAGAADQGRPAPSPSAGDGIDMLRRAWPDILDALSRIKRSSWALVSQDATPLRYDNQTLHLGFSTEGLAGRFNSGEHAENLRQAISSTLGLDCRVSAGVGTSGGDAPGPKAPAEPAWEPAQSWEPAIQSEPVQSQESTHGALRENTPGNTRISAAKQGPGSAPEPPEPGEEAAGAVDWPEITPIPKPKTPGPKATPAVPSEPVPSAHRDSEPPEYSEGASSRERIWRSSTESAPSAVATSPASGSTTAAPSPSPAPGTRSRPDTPPLGPAETPRSAASGQETAPGPGPQHPHRRYDQLQQEAHRTALQEPSAGIIVEDTAEDIPSADDETIEESRLIGVAAVERILGGKLLEERPVTREN